MGITPEQAEFVNELVNNKISFIFSQIEKISKGDIFKLTRECYDTIIGRGIPIEKEFQIQLYKDLIEMVNEHGKEEKKRAS